MIITSFFTQSYLRKVLPAQLFQNRDRRHTRLDQSLFWHNKRMLECEAPAEGCVWYTIRVYQPRASRREFLYRPGTFLFLVGSVFLQPIVEVQHESVIPGAFRD